MRVFIDVISVQPPTMCAANMGARCTRGYRETAIKLADGTTVSPHFVRLLHTWRIPIRRMGRVSHMGVDGCTGRVIDG